MLSRSRWNTFAFLLALGLVVWAGGPTTQAQVKKGKTRPAETKQLMKGIMQPNCAGVGKLLEKGAPDDKGWEELAQYAAILNEMSFVVMQDGRCPDKDWAGAAKTLGECSGKLIEAVKAKNVDDTKTSFKAMTSACAACHKAHKKPA